MSYIYQSTDNILWNRDLPATNITTVWILSIGIKEPTTVTQVMKDISSKNLTGKCNSIQSITALRDTNIVRTIIQENISILNKIRNVQAIG